MKNYLPWAVSTVLAVVLFFQIFKKEEIRTITIPSVSNSKIIDAPKPIVIHDTIFLKSGDTIYKPLVNTVNQELLKKYTNLADSLSRIELYKDAITQRTYREVLDDSIQTIHILSKVQGGMLLNQEISYVTKPSEYVIKTKSLKTEFFVGVFTTIPTQTQSYPSIGLNFSIKKSRTIYTVGIDNQKNITGSIAFKIF